MKGDSLSRRRFLLVAFAAVPLLGCQTVARSARPSRPTATPVPTLAFPKPMPPAGTPAPLAAAPSAGTPAPLAAAPLTVEPLDVATDQQQRVIPPLPPQSTPYATRTLPPVRLLIPSVELDARVVPIGTAIGRDGAPIWQTAPFAVGHHQGSANPGEPGNVVLSGHVSSPREGGVFQRLPQVRPGDAVIVVTAQQHHLYRVRETKIVLPTAVEYLEPTPISVVTLITCVPDGIYSHRLIVRAEAV